MILTYLQITKHISKVNGVPVFTALLTVTNERGEIRICDLVATKSHSQFEGALKQMNASLQCYGHKPTSVFYTDNMADKHMLESSFPSLLENVVPIEKYAHLEPLEIPDDVLILVKESPAQIDTAILTILDALPEDGHITVGFDTEWNVDLADRRRGGEREMTAVIQIAFEKQIYIMKVYHLCYLYPSI